MRGRQEIKEGMEIDQVSKLKEEPQLSGAYIRSLVKQLTSSRAKDPTNPNDPDSVDGNGFNDQNSAKFSEGIRETPQTKREQPRQHKKQVRRRLHTSRPYQERLLNMAEARREIVTALKFHRAAMKQADEQRQKQQQQQREMQQQQSPSLHVSSPCFVQEARMKSRRNPRIYPSSTNNLSYLDSFSCSSFSHPHPPQNPFSWPVSTVLPSAAENLNFPLPNQPLGLNLNFHDFNNIDITLYHNSNNNPSINSSSSPSSSSSPTLSVVTEAVPSAAVSYEGGPSSMAEAAESYVGPGLHHAMDDEEMAEIRSIGEQHRMEWNDTVNLMTSAWWFKFLSTMELGPEVKVEDDGYTPFDQVMEFPDWLNASESCLQQYFDDYHSDPALPCMEIGEIGGMDGDWLA